LRPTPLFVLWKLKVKQATVDRGLHGVAVSARYREWKWGWERKEKSWSTPLSRWCKVDPLAAPLRPF